MLESKADRGTAIQHLQVCFLANLVKFSFAYVFVKLLVQTLLSLFLTIGCTFHFRMRLFGKTTDYL
jgi:hypothetical protein